MNFNWKEMPKSHKIATVIAGIAAVFGVISKLMPDLFGMDLMYPAISVFTACEAIVYWQNNRKWAKLLIAGAGISLVFFILELLLLQ